jgi:hypothetical protein
MPSFGANEQYFKNQKIKKAFSYYILFNQLTALVIRAFYDSWKYLETILLERSNVSQMY